MIYSNAFYKLRFFLTLSWIFLPAQANILLQKPPVITQSQVEVITKNWGTSFNWHIAANCSFECFYEHGGPGFVLKVFNFPVRSSGVAKEPAQAVKPRTRSYFFDQPLNFDAPSPIQITVSELVSLVNNKRFIFYTGAGISMAGGVFSMKGLENSLGMGSGKINFLKTALLYPETVSDAFGRFCQSAVYAEPTAAHHALHQISQAKENCILTENVDLLQHRTGSVPVHSQSDKLDPDKVSPEDWQAVDLIICVGLSHDDCGLLGYYKRLNPLGKLVSIDLGVPNYLSKTDYLLQADAQTVLPRLALNILQDKE